MNDSLYIMALYRFERVEYPNVLQTTLREAASSNGVRGTVIVASEGINGTLAGTKSALEHVLAVCRRFVALDTPRFDRVEQWPFNRLFVHLKQEIVTMGVRDIDPTHQRGTYVEPADWNRFIDDPEFLVIDTRNDFEVRLGTFNGAENPVTDSFADFPDWADSNVDRLKAAKGVVMFCTGGIRCEKATSYLRRLGVNETFHLRGGILSYLHEVSSDNNRFSGDCFVFDERVAVGRQLGVNASVEMCFGCRHPVTAEMRSHTTYELGVSCPDCFHVTTEAQKSKYRARQSQFTRKMRVGAKGGSHS